MVLSNKISLCLLMQTASLLTMAVYMMCEHPDMVTRLRSEILGKVGNRRPTYEDIRDMKYLRAFLNGAVVYYRRLQVFTDSII